MKDCLGMDRELFERVMRRAALHIRISLGCLLAMVGLITAMVVAIVANRPKESIFMLLPLMIIWVAGKISLGRAHESSEIVSLIIKVHDNEGN